MENIVQTSTHCYWLINDLSTFYSSKCGNQPPNNVCNHSFLISAVIHTNVTKEKQCLSSSDTQEDVMLTVLSIVCRYKTIYYQKDVFGKITGLQSCMWRFYGMTHQEYFLCWLYKLLQGELTSSPLNYSIVSLDANWFCVVSLLNPVPL